MKKLFIYFYFFLISISFSDEIIGKASYYGGKFHGRLTANGEIFDKNKLTAAHKTLKFGTIVTVTNLNNSKSVDVVINDRGPFIEGREIDLSEAAFKEIGNVDSGVLKVKIEY